MSSSSMIPWMPGVFDLKALNTSFSLGRASGGAKALASRSNNFHATEPPVTLELKSAASMSFASRGGAALLSASV